MLPSTLMKKEMTTMDLIKKKAKKTSNVVTVYLRDKDLKALEILRDMDVNVSMVCRQAIRDAAWKVMKGGEKLIKKENLVVSCNGDVFINMQDNTFLFDNGEILDE
jgi:hypothetical protein